MKSTCLKFTKKYTYLFQTDFRDQNQTHNNEFQTEQMNQENYYNMKKKKRKKKKEDEE